MILFLYGEDTFRSRRYLDQSIEKFKRERDPHGYNVVRLDGKKSEPGRLVAEISSAPFLAAKRLVVVENMASSSDKEVLATLIEKIEKQSIPESTVVIFWQGEAIGKVKEAKVLFELLAKEKYAQNFEALAGSALVQSIKKDVEARGGSIEPAAIDYLVRNCGTDSWFIHTLIEQLIAYKNGQPIKQSDVVFFLPEKLDNNIFSMVDAVINGRHQVALNLLYEQRRLGQDDMQLFSLILWQFRVLLQIADFTSYNQVAPADVMAKALGLHPFVVKKNLQLVRKYSLAKLKSVYRELEAIDRRTKTGQADQALMLDMLVSTL